MKFGKKIFVLIALLTIILFNSNAMALENEEVYYTNDNGVNFTKEEYDFVSKFYFDGYQKLMTQDDYNYIIDNQLMNGEIKVTQIVDPGSLNSRASDYYATGSKKLQLSSSCSSTCSMTITLTWLVSPNVRSYDLIGAYSPTSDSMKFTGARFYYDGVVKEYNEYRQESHGVSATFKLPTVGEDIVLVFNFKANKGSTVYASYQHAKKTISLANSRKYSFNSGGYGSVFLFEESVNDYYDAMRGVKMTLS